MRTLTLTIALALLVCACDSPEPPSGPQTKAPGAEPEKKKAEPAKPAEPPKPQALELVTLTGHGSDVNCLCFSPDGGMLAAGDDEMGRLWDPIVATCDATLDEHSTVVFGMAFSADGKLVATAGRDGKIFLWDTLIGSKKRVLAGPMSSSVRCVAFAPDGSRLAAGLDMIVNVWNPEDGELDYLVRMHDGIISCIAYSGDGSLLATGGYDKTIQVKKIEGEDTVPEITGHDGPVLAIAFSPDAKTLVSGSEDGTARFWSTADGKEIRSLTGHGGAVCAVAFSPDGKNVLTADGKGVVRIWDASTGKEIRSIDTEKPARRAAFSPDCRFAALAEGKEIRIWKLE
ncbi:MAG: WD40 repeat domain-containing protein [Planctomycetota bacterium]|jgi:WD40 repeat protein